MSETLTIYGANDDAVEIEGSFEGCDEYTSNGKSVFLVEAPDGGNVLVYVTLHPGAIWSVGVSQYEEEYKIPDWNIRIVHDFALCKYSAILLMDLPEGSKIVELNKKGQPKKR